jgi:hypothetical protein
MLSYCPVLQYGTSWREHTLVCAPAAVAYMYANPPCINCCRKIIHQDYNVCVGRKLLDFLFYMYRVSEKECTHFKHFCWKSEQCSESTVFTTWNSYSESFPPTSTFLYFTALQPDLSLLLAQCPSGSEMPWKRCHTFEAVFLPQKGQCLSYLNL